MGSNLMLSMHFVVLHKTILLFYLIFIQFLNIIFVFLNFLLIKNNKESFYIFLYILITEFNKPCYI